MKNYFLIFIFLLTLSCQPSQKEKVVTKDSNVKQEVIHTFYVGTYTDGDSKGIYKLALQSDGKLQQVALAGTSNNPSFLTKSSDRKFLIAVNETDEPASKGGTVESYKVSGDSLELLSRKPSGGAHPCFVTINDEGYILTSNYTGGSIGLLQLDEQGMLSDLLDVEQHTGKGTTDRQEAPHAHSAHFIANTNDIVSVDLGTNELWFSQINTEQDQPKLEQQHKIAMETSAGPRHLAFHPNGQWLYVINELNTTVTLLVKDESGQFQKQESISTLPTDYTGENFCADIHISSDGKFLYASNRGHNSIATFSINSENGLLQSLSHTAVAGKWPRNFALSPDGNYLLVANQHSNNIVSFKRDQATGLLTQIAQIEVPSPVCILF